MAQSFKLDSKWRLAIASAAGLKPNSTCYVAVHPGTSNRVLAVLPKDLKTTEPAYMEHLSHLNVHPSSVEGYLVNVDAQGRAAIPTPLRDGPANRPLTVATIGNVPFIFLSSNPIEVKGHMSTLMSRSFARPSAEKPPPAMIYVPPHPEGLDGPLRRDQAIRRGTSEHRKNLLFSRHRRAK